MIMFDYDERGVLANDYVIGNQKYSTNTNSLAKEFLKILIFEYFGYLKVGFEVFFDADSESPRMT